MPRALRMEDRPRFHKDIVHLEEILDGTSQPTGLKLSLLEYMTDDFSKEREIGRGGYGVVYMGNLNNRDVAVKKLTFSNVTDKDFDREVHNLMRVKHGNIVKFLGYCNNTNGTVVNMADPGETESYATLYNQERIICFEYVSNGSLSDHIHDELRGLEWHARYGIIKGICEALNYLHNKNFVHRDLKPDNILMDNLMSPKIADLGISKLVGASKSMTTSATATWEYAPQEFEKLGEVSVKYDIYSLGIIIIELVTGYRRIRDLKSVLTRWRHRWNKTNETLRYQQVAKCIEIGLSCQHDMPEKRPFISKIIKELSDVDDGNGTLRQKIPRWNELLWIEPPELFFPFQANKKIFRSLELHNKADDYMAFFIKTYSHVKYEIEPIKGIINPRSHFSVSITLAAQEDAPEKMWNIEEFLVKSKKIIGGLTFEEITTKMFSKKSGVNVVDRITIGVVFDETERAPCCVSDEPKETSSMVESSKHSTSRELDNRSAEELIQLDPPEIRFPFLTIKKVPMFISIKITNVTNYHVGFNSWTYKRNSAWYTRTPAQGILAPGSTQVLKIKRLAKENASEDMHCKDDIVGLWNGIVNEGTEAKDLVTYQTAEESKLLPIVFTKTDICTSDELIQFDPSELRFPSLPNKKVPMVCSIKIVNVTDHYVGFNRWSYKSNSAWYYTFPDNGILPPGSTKEIKIKRVGKENESEVMECKDVFNMWNGIVNEGFEFSDIAGYREVKESKHLPIVFTKTNLCTSDELIQFHPPELCFPFLPNKRVPMLCSTKIVNVTNHYVGFRSWNYKSNSASYSVTPSPGILPPNSTQVLKIKRMNESEDMQCKDDIIFLWNGIVNEDIEARDLVNHTFKEESKQLPIDYTKTEICTSDELIKFDPPELQFPSLPNKKVPMVCSIKIVNVTDHYVGFNRWMSKSNSGWYQTVPSNGILPPRSTTELKVKRVGKENESEDMECKDKYSVWNGIVNEGFESSDLAVYMDDKESKHLPIVFTKTEICTPDELIRFDPPELHFPSLPNKKVPMVCSIKIVNVTDHYVGFNRWMSKSNSGWYQTVPSNGILPPRSTTELKVKRVGKENESEDMECKDKYSVWNGIVNEGFESSDLAVYMDDKESKHLPIVFTKTEICTPDELIRFEPPELHFPSLPNKKVPMVCSIKIVNVTDHYVGFNRWMSKSNSGSYHTLPFNGILPPRSTTELKVKRVGKENESEDMECKDEYSVWNGIVNEGFDSSALAGYMEVKESKHLPIVFTKTNLCTPDELIQFDPPELRFPFLPNKRVPMLCSIKIVNVTDHYVGFRSWISKSNLASYLVTPELGILLPNATQVLKIKRRNESEDMHCKDDIFGLWNGIVNEDIEARDLVHYMNREESKQVPIDFTETNLCHSDELIQLHPPELRFPSFPNKKVPMVGSIEIINVTDHCVGFNTWSYKSNSAWYTTLPRNGILQPGSKTELKVKRVGKENESADMECKDVFNVWTGIVNEGFEASDLPNYMVDKESKHLPVVFTEPGESSSP